MLHYLYEFFWYLVVYLLGYWCGWKEHQKNYEKRYKGGRIEPFKFE